MSSLDPQSSWIQWGLTGIATAFSALVGLFVSFGRDAHKVYREKVDALERAHAAFAATCITRDEFLKEMNRRSDETDVRSLQMHNHNAKLMEGIGVRIGDLKDSMDTRMGELRGDIGKVHERIDGLKKK